MSMFLHKHHAQNLVKENTCFKNPDNPSCIDLFLTNSNLSFQNTITVSTGISDFHKMIVTVFKTTFNKVKPKEIVYRNYKTFNKIAFETDLKKLALSRDCNNYNDFESIFLSVVEKKAPLKKKLLRANHAPYMTKTLRKAIMRRSELETKFHKAKSTENLINYKKQKNFVSRLYKREKKSFYQNLNLKDIACNKNFWKNMKPLFSDKNPSNRNITIIEDNEILSDDLDVAEKLNEYFKNAVNLLELEVNPYIMDPTVGCNDSIEEAITKFKNHPSIIRIKEKNESSLFNFTEVNLSEIEKELQNLNPKKSTTFNNVPPKLLKLSGETCAPTLCYLMNKTFQTCIFPEKLKLADITPVFKKDDSTKLKNYRPVSILPTASKIFERIIHKQITAFMEKYLSPYLCGYRKGFNTQQALISLLEKWKQNLDKGGYAGAILMDLSKAFDTINHDLLIAKLNAYGFHKDALALIKSYLTNRWQRTKINGKFSSWIELLLGVPQGSVLGPLLFNIYINDLFWINEETDVCNYADDTTFYSCHDNISEVMRCLEHDSSLTIEWFESNFMKLNNEKCHFLISGHKHEHMFCKIGSSQIWESQKEKLLGVYLDRNLSFNYHISNTCNKANRKLSALTRISGMLTLEQRRVLMKSFIESQFSYCPLVWMFCDRHANAKINKVHARALRIVYKDDISSFEELLLKDGSVTRHHKNIQTMAIEIYKTKQEICPTLMHDIFIDRVYEGPHLRSNTDFFLPKVRTVHFGQDSLRYFGTKIWSIVPEYLKNMNSLGKFKSEIKLWVPSKCPCRLCKTYIKDVGYI